MLKKLGTLALGAVVVAGGLWWAGARNDLDGLGQSLLPAAAHAQDTTAGSGAADTGTKASDTKAGDTKAGDAKAELPKVPDYSLGNPDAKVKVIEYGAFTCPHCREFHADVWPKLKKNYIDTGKIDFTFRAFYLQRYGLWANMVARCGGEMRYYGIADMLFDKQPDWAYTQDPSKAIEGIRKIGLAAGLTKDQMDQCLHDGKMAQALVAKFQKYAKQDGIEGTPTFMINGKKYTNMGYDKFSKILDGLLKN